MTRPLPAWIRRIFGILTLGGGAVGVVVMLIRLAQVEGTFAQAIVGIFLVLGLFGIVCGTGLIEGRQYATRLSHVYWLMQLPVFTTSWLSYGFANGYRAAVWVRPFQGTMGIDTTIGSDGTFNLMQAVDDPSFGLNLYAMAIVLVLRWYLRPDRKIVTASTIDAPKIDAPKSDAAKSEAPKVENTAKSDVPTIDATAKNDTPTIDTTPKSDASTIGAGPV